MILWAALGVAAVPGAGTSTSSSVLAVILLVACVGGLAVAATVSRARVAAAIQAAGHPALTHWPPSPSARERDRRAGWSNAGKTALAAALVGIAGGFVPVLGPGLAAGGWAGAVGTALVWRMVRRYEEASGSFLVTARPDRADGQRVGLELGLVRRPPNPA